MKLNEREISKLCLHGKYADVLQNFRERIEDIEDKLKEAEKFNAER